MGRYILQKSNENPLWWVLTDTETQIVCTFKEGEFNETQKFTPLNDVQGADMMKLPSIVKDMTSWLCEHHYNIVISSPQEVIARARASIGAQIKAEREEQGITLRDLAHITGIAFNHISRIEQGKYNVTLDTLAVIADALDMDISLIPYGLFVEDEVDE